MSIQAETADFIAAHTKELATLAHNAKLETLAYILGIAQLEAEAQRSNAQTEEKQAA